MANAAIAYRNLADAGTVSASSEEAAMPASRLQNEHVGKRWRSTAEPAAAICDLGETQAIDTIALLGMTAGATSSVRARLTSAAAGNDAFTKVLLHFDGADASTTFTDSNAGGSARTWTAAGDAQIDTAQSKFGGASGLFDGTGDSISTPDSADFALGNSDFTIDFWFNCTAAAGSGRAIAAQADGSITPSLTSFDLRRSALNIILFRLSDGTSLPFVQSTATYTDVSNPGWHHCAIVRSGNNLRMYIDGLLVSAVSFTGTVPDSASNLVIGNAWQGWIDEFRLSVGIARWTSNFTPPQAPYGDPAFGDLHDATFDATDAAYDTDYGAFILPLAAPISARYVRLDITDGPASYVEAGRLFVGLREAFDYNFAPGAAVTWTDRSRKTVSAGGQTLIFRDNKVRSAELNFEWVSAEQRYGLVETIDRVNGQSIDVLLILDTDSDNLARDSIFGLISAPTPNLYGPISDIFARAYRIEERK